MGLGKDYLKRRKKWREVKRDSKIAVSAFITILLMPLTYSISIGLCFGFISYILMHVVSKEAHKVSLTLWIIGIL